MEDKLVIIALLPYSQAELLRSMLEAEGIGCSLRNVNLIQGAVAAGVKVAINEKDIQRAYPILNALLGKPAKEKQRRRKTILVPVDFSDCSFKAAIDAFKIAGKLKARIIFFHVIPNPDFFSMPYTDVISFDMGMYEHMREREEQASNDFREFLRKLADHIGTKEWDAVKSEHIIKMGYPEDDILFFTENHSPMLLVMGIRGPSPSSNGDVMGSTTAGVIYKSKAPVLVIPEKAPLLDLASVKKVVYATNFDDKDFISIDKLVALLKPFNTRIYCLHIGDGTQEAWVKARLESMDGMLKAAYPDTRIKCVMTQGQDVQLALEEYISNNDIDILSLTTHRRNMITRFFNPSITRKMLYHVSTPLLVFHS